MVQRRALLFLPVMLMPARAAAVTPATLLEVNEATRAQLESLPGIGPALAERMLLARQNKLFSDWADLRRRVRGTGEATARKLSAQGLRVNGLTFET